MLMKRMSPAAIGGDTRPARSAIQSFVRYFIIRRWLSVVGAWIGRNRQRHALADLDDRLLEDVGISRGAAAREIAKPFWR